MKSLHFAGIKDLPSQSFQPFIMDMLKRARTELTSNGRVESRCYLLRYRDVEGGCLNIDEVAVDLSQGKPKVGKELRQMAIDRKAEAVLCVFDSFTIAIPHLKEFQEGIDAGKWETPGESPFARNGLAVILETDVGAWVCPIPILTIDGPNTKTIPTAAFRFAKFDADSMLILPKTKGPSDASNSLFD